MHFIKLLSFYVQVVSIMPQIIREIEIAVQKSRKHTQLMCLNNGILTVLKNAFYMSPSSQKVSMSLRFPIFIMRFVFSPGHGEHTEPNP